MKRPSSADWNWTAYALDVNNRDLIVYADITKSEVLQDGKTYIPIYGVDHKINIASDMAWVRFSCNTRFTEYLKFEGGKPAEIREAKDGDAARNLMVMVCGTYNGIYGIVAASNYWILGYKLSEIIPSHERPNILNFRLYEYSINGQINSNTEAQLDCATQLISGIYRDNPNTFSPSHIDKQQLKHFAARVCLAGRNSTPTTTSEQQKKMTTEDQDKSSKTSIKEAKLKCEQLGFKPKTEKFGKCVLELTK
jgi:hypothetical protein